MTAKGLLEVHRQRTRKEQEAAAAKATEANEMLNTWARCARGCNCDADDAGRCPAARLKLCITCLQVKPRLCAFYQQPQYQYARINVPARDLMGAL